MKKYIIDENKLKTELQKEFNGKEEEMKPEDIYKIYKIILDMTRNNSIFKNLPESLTRLAYNILYIQIYNRIINYSYGNTTISEIKNSITQTYAIIDIIKEAAKQLDSESKKQAFYRLIGNNHIIIASVYKHKKNFYDSSINILREKAGIPELDGKITSKDAIIKLFELTESKKYSRLQRVFDILMKHGDNLIITDNNGVEHSNIDNLGICNDDIYSLQLLARIEDSDFSYFTSFFINSSIYNSIYSEDLYNSIFELYNTIYIMSSMDNGFNSYKDKKKDIINTCLNQLKNNINAVDLNDIDCDITISEECGFIVDHKDFDIDNFRDIVIQNYLISIKSDADDIRMGTLIENTENKGILSKTIIIMAIIIIIFIIILSIIFGLYPNETKEIMNNLNIM
ncbi:hypothetical protein NEIRO03_1842 [Nematocida sp. AWRm78]|nr:hypothetical protein NEIRO02_2045 [Nematocida sp. AWRm79]KAI5184837.1 hypothetical protein NEIRO03_1842 [Nematocida sp. AWRm78]